MPICSIHQPNFFPWIGFFDKINRSDIFVLQDNILLGDPSYTKRVKILMNNEETWLSCPITKETKKGLILNAIINNTDNWKNKTVRKIFNYYRKAPNFNVAFKIIEEAILNSEDNLSRYNTQAIMKISELLFGEEVLEKFIFMSDLKVEGSKNDLIISICKSVNCDQYMHGSGAHNYQDEKKFIHNNINLLKQSFDEKSFWGAKEFVPGLSIIHYLMHRKL